VFVDDLEDPVLRGTDRHHLVDVLRVAAGAVITVADGEGSWRPAVLGDDVVPDGPIVQAPAPQPQLTVAFTPVKGDRPEWVVQKLTELGVDRIVVLHTQRSVVRWAGDRAPRQLERLARVAREAAMQCRRPRLPVVDGLFSVAEVAAWPGAAAAERGGHPPSLDHPLVLVGPEGGWSPQESALLPHRVGLGPHTLRAETAAVAVGSLLAALRAELVDPRPAQEVGPDPLSPADDAE
jgi:16S rRNA (uracil1498-N3)-methyltransferase